MDFNGTLDLKELLDALLDHCGGRDYRRLDSAIQGESEAQGEVDSITAQLDSKREELEFVDMEDRESTESEIAALKYTLSRKQELLSVAKNKADVERLRASKVAMSPAEQALAEKELAVKDSELALHQTEKEHTRLEKEVQGVHACPCEGGRAHPHTLVCAGESTAKQAAARCQGACPAQPTASHWTLSCQACASPSKAAQLEDRLDMCELSLQKIVVQVCRFLAPTCSC